MLEGGGDMFFVDSQYVFFAWYDAYERGREEGEGERGRKRERERDQTIEQARKGGR